MAEDGLHPEFARLYGATAHTSEKYPPRTWANVKESDATLVFDTAPCKSLSDMSAGSKATIRACMETETPNVTIPVRLGEPIHPKTIPRIIKWIHDSNIRVLNVAGNRESKSPGIGAWVEEFLCEMFRAMGLVEPAAPPSTPAPR